MRLISAEQAKMALDWNLIGDEADVAREIIDRLPAVDAVIVTRCKDCKYFKMYKCRMGYSRFDDFCSCGEPKEGNND